MRNRSSLFAILMALAVLPPGLAAAQKLDKDDKKWLDDVRPILLGGRGEDLQGPQGQERPARVPEDLLGAARSRPRDAGERVPGASTRRPAPTADQQYRVAGAAPARNTDCGRTFILLGKPDEVQDDAAGSPGLRRPRDLDLPRPARPHVPGRQGA